MSRTRTLIAVALAAVVLAGMLASSALNDTPPRSGPPTLAAQELTSAEDLREFAIIANRDLGASDWVSLRRSTIPGSERSCSAEAFAAHGAADLREAALAVEARSLRRAPRTFSSYDCLHWSGSPPTYA